VSDVSGYLIVQQCSAAISRANRYQALTLRFGESLGTRLP